MDFKALVPGPYTEVVPQVQNALSALEATVGSGDMVGPASSINDRIAVFDGTTGKLVKDGGSTIAEIVAGSGGLVTSVFGRTGNIVAVTNDYTWAQINKATSSLADITTRSATDLTSGTLPDARFPSTLPAVSGASLTNLNASSLASGTVPDARFPATLPAVSGVNLTNLNASNLASGTLPAARMPALTGDVTTSAGTVATTIANNAVITGKIADNAVTLAKLADIATASFLGRNTASTGDPEVLSIATAKSMLGISNFSVAGPTSARTYTFPDANATIARTDAAQTFTGLQTFANDILVSSATANLFLKDSSSGWQVASTTVITPQNNNIVRSTSYTSGLVGWNISALGNAEFNNVDVRGAIRASIFTYNAISATAGTLGVFKSAGKLRTDVVIPAGPTYGTTTVVIEIEDPEGLTHAAGQVFTGNDILRIKDGLVGDTWFRVNAVSDQTTFWRYSAIIMAGSANVTYRKGMAVADYGQSGQGFIIQTADQANAPYLQMATHASNFTSNDAAGTLTVFPRLRIGNLNGSYGYAADTFGFGTGQYGTAGQSWVTVDSTNGVRLGNNTTTRIHLAADGSGFLASNNISWTTAGAATISGWVVGTTSLSKNEVTVAAGVNPSLTAGTGEAWFGKSATGYYGLLLKGTTAASLAVVAGNSAIGSAGRPYIFINDGTLFRIVLGELNTTVWDGAATNSMGMKIWSSAGSLLVHFSDVANVIAGWAISATKISSTGIDLHSGASAALAFGTTPPTSASAGTGIWLDRTGLYGLLSGAVQAKLDAATGAITAGQGNVVLDANGVSIALGDLTRSRITWKDGGSVVRGHISVDSSNNMLLRASSGEIRLGDESNLEGQIRVDGAGATVKLHRMDGGVAIGSTAAGTVIPASTILALNSTAGAFLPPRMTTTQRDALTATDGHHIYNTTLATAQYRKAGAWVSY